jgi:glycosyltransferase involved in cell wall biosynthesis
MSSKVSVIIPCYNLSDYLSETLQSVLNQSYSNWECIIVNDGSIDNTEVVALEYVNKYSKFQYYCKINEGVALARNFGIQISQGDYILPLDADDIIDQDYLKMAVEVLDANPEFGIVYCKAKFFGKYNGTWDLQKYDLQTMLLDNIIFSSSFFRRSDFFKTNGYNPNMRLGFEDWDFWLSLIELDIKVYQLPYVLFYYRQHDLSRNKVARQNIQKLYKQLFFNHAELYLKNFPDPISSYIENSELQNRIKKIQNSIIYRIINKLIKLFNFHN